MSGAWCWPHYCAHPTTDWDQDPGVLNAASLEQGRGPPAMRTTSPPNKRPTLPLALTRSLLCNARTTNRSMEQGSPMGRVISPPPERFAPLFWLGLFAAGALQVGGRVGGSVGTALL